jgi:hypothetical protein
VFDFSIFYIDSTMSAFLPVWKPHVDGSKWGATKLHLAKLLTAKQTYVTVCYWPDYVLRQPAGERLLHARFQPYGLILLSALATA